MPLHSLASRILDQEARALITRLGKVRPFVLVEPMLTAAAPLPHTQSAIDGYLIRGRKELLAQVEGFLRWLESVEGQAATAEAAQRKFTFLRLRFNAVITQFDMFSVAVSQRSENEFGVWLAGLDVAAADALALPGFYDAPPVLCYLDRGIGAAIRRARTRLPGGGENPVALIRIPRERMIGYSIASSLVHEVGHQGAALLDLVPALRAGMPPAEGVWRQWHRWISEIVADLWSVSRVGVAAPLGLIGVVSLPKPFVFRANEDDPHPMPWIRVLLSAAMGHALYPHPQWRQVMEMWESFYPPSGLDAATAALVERLRAGIPEFVDFLASFRPASLRGLRLGEALARPDRAPVPLLARFALWSRRPQAFYEAPPTLAFAVLGQARLDGKLSAEEESTLLGKLLTHWALKTTLDTSTYCAMHAASRPAAAAQAAGGRIETLQFTF